MRILTTLAAACVAFAVMGCESGDNGDMVAPGAVSADCCGGSCGEKAEVAPGAVSECGASCASSCGDKADKAVAPGAVSECGSSCASSCGDKADKAATVAPGAMSECPASACSKSCGDKSL